MTNAVKRFIDTARRLLKVDRALDEVKMNQGRILSAMHQGVVKPHLWQYEFKVFSQSGEDGIVQFLVNHLNIENETFIEFGVEDFSESNCRFLMMKDQWRGFVLDGSPKNIERLERSNYFWQHGLRCRSAFVTRDNIEALLESSGFDKQLGILSVDLDGVDYHVLERLESWRPSILIVEYNDAFSHTRPVTVPYDANFVRRDKHFSNQYWGANLAAFHHLADRRGYALVGINSAGQNAFFVRRELVNDFVREVPLSACTREAAFRDSRGKDGALTFLSGRERAAAMADMPLLDVASGQTLTVGELLG